MSARPHSGRPSTTLQASDSRGGRRCLALIVIMAAVLAPVPAQPPPANDSPSGDTARPFILRVGMSNFAFRDVNLNDATAAYGLFVKNLARTHDFEAVVQTELFSDATTFQRALRRETNALQICSIPAWDYLAMDPPADLHPRFVALRNGRSGRRYIVLTKRDRGCDQLADLRGRAITQLEFTTSGAAAAWLLTTLHDAGLPAPAACFGTITPAARALNTILPVFFDQQAACVVDEPSFELMRELNPQVGTSLQVIARSEPFVDIVMCISDRGWPTPNQKAAMLAAIPQLGDSPTGRQVLTLFKVDALVPFADRDLDTLRALRLRWTALRQDPGP